MNLPKFAIMNQPIVLCGVVLLIAYGVYTWNTAPRKEDPSFNVRDAWIITVWPGATAEEVERLVADPIELQMAGIKTTRKLDTSCYAGLCMLLFQAETLTRQTRVSMCRPPADSMRSSRFRM
jgi:multidrug efflux pump subunit AcrB